MLSTVQSKDIDSIWNKIEPLIKRVYQKVDLWYTLDKIKESLLSQEMQLWTSQSGTQIKSICITQLVVHPKYKYLDIILMAGEIDSVQHLAQIEDWARTMGCKKVKLTGRKGWLKFLNDYEIGQLTLQKEL